MVEFALSVCLLAIVCSVDGLSYLGHPREPLSWVELGDWQDFLMSRGLRSYYEATGI